jgi:hypothetical protein
MTREPARVLVSEMHEFPGKSMTVASPDGRRSAKMQRGTQLPRRVGADVSKRALSRSLCEGFL